MINQMFELYFAPTPNGQKITILLEELELPYQLIAVDLLNGEQHTTKFRTLNPYGKIPVLVDHHGPGGAPMTLYESGAILWYLANKYQRFKGETPRQEALVMQWLMFQMGNLGPFLGQAHHFFNYAPEMIDYAQKRYYRQATLMYEVLNARLGEHPFLAETYSIADMAVYPWVSARRAHRIDLNDYPAVASWHQTIKQRPAVRRGFAPLRDRLPSKLEPEHRKHLFGQQQNP